MLYTNNELNTAFRRTSALFIFSIIFTFQTQVLAADLKLKTAEDYRLIGYGEQQKGNYGKALEYYTKVLELVGDNAVILNDMGVIYESLGISQRAEEYYLDAIRVNEDYLPPYTNIAYLYKSLGDIDKAVGYFKERYRRADPKDPWKKKIKAELDAIDPEIQKRILEEEAKKLADELVSKAHDEFYVRIVRSNKHYERAQELVKKQDYQEALLEFDRALQLTPNNPKLKEAKKETEFMILKQDVANHSQTALQLLSIGKTESAKEEYRKILTIIPDEPKKESE